MVKKDKAKFKVFNSENVEIITAKKLQDVEKQGPSSSGNSASNSETKPIEPRTKKGGESSKSAPEERYKTEVKPPDSIQEVKTKIKLPKKEISRSAGQAHHNVDKTKAIQHVLVENDDKADGVHTKVLDRDLTTSAENKSGYLVDTSTNILDKEKVIINTLEEARTELKSPNTTNMEHIRKDVQGSKPKPDNPAWVNSATRSLLFPKPPFSGLNPNASEFTPGSCFGTINPCQSNIGQAVENTNPALPDAHPVLQREIMPSTVSPGVPIQPNRTSTRTSMTTSAQFANQSIPSPFRKNSSQEEPSNLPAPSIASVEWPSASCNPPLPDRKNSTSAWDGDRIRRNPPSEQCTERSSQNSPGVPPTTTYAQQAKRDSAQVPRPSSQEISIQPKHGAPSLSSNWSDEKNAEQSYTKPNHREDGTSHGRFQGNRDSFNRNSFQDKRGGRGRGRGGRQNEDKEGTRGVGGGEKRFNERESREFGGRRSENRFRSTETERKNQYPSNDDWDEAPKENKRNSEERQQETYGNVRNPPKYDPTRNRGHDNRGRNDANRTRGYENTAKLQREQNRGLLDKNIDSSDRDEDTRQDAGDNVTSTTRGDDEKKMLETANKSGTSWRDRTSDDSNRFFTNKRDDRYRGRDTSNTKRDRDTNNPKNSTNRARGGVRESRGRGNVQFTRGSRRGNERGKYNSTRTNRNDDEVRRNSTEAIEIANDDSSKDSADSYHITDEESSDIPEKIVELTVDSPENICDKSAVSRDSDVREDWNDSMDIEVEAGSELGGGWNAMLADGVEDKSETPRSIENISGKEDGLEASDMSKRKSENRMNQGTSRNSWHNPNGKWDGQRPRKSHEKMDPRMERDNFSHTTNDRRDQPRRSYDKEPRDPRMERENFSHTTNEGRDRPRRSYDKTEPSDPRKETLNRSVGSSHLDASTNSSGARSLESRLKQSRITSFIDQDDEKEHSDKEFDRWKGTWHKIEDFHVVREIQGDLFEQPKDFSLAHCVAEDLRMGSGIAVDFKREFKNLDDLLDQKAKQGGLATLHDKENGRFVYYLVTKRESTGKPTYLTLWRSLNKMRDHMKENEVKKLAIPRLACGLDRLEWNTVKAMIEHLFLDMEVDITVCNFQQDDEIVKKSPTRKLVFEEFPITKIEPGTLIFYFTTEKGDVDETMVELSKKFNFLTSFKSHKSKKLGEIVYAEDREYGLCGCIVRKTLKDPLSFKGLLSCVEAFTKKNKSFKENAFSYVAYQWANERDYFDILINQKIITILINCLKFVDVYVCRGTFDGSGENQDFKGIPLGPSLV